MHQQTKYCEPRIHLSSGAIVSGRFHTVEDTSSAIRPFDAIRDAKGGFLLLTHANVNDGAESSEQSTVMVNHRAITYIELPSEHWITGHG